MIEKYVQEIEEQFGRESVSVVQRKPNGGLTKPVVVKGKESPRVMYTTDITAWLVWSSMVVW